MEELKRMKRGEIEADRQVVITNLLFDQTSFIIKLIILVGRLELIVFYILHLNGYSEDYHHNRFKS